jgi:NADPH-dependent curcumin reductase CurA
MLVALRQDAVLPLINDRARIVICGQISYLHVQIDRLLV